MACGIDGRWGYAAWCSPPSSNSHTWIDDEPYPGRKSCPTCGAKRARIHVNITVGDRNVVRRGRQPVEGIHGWQRSTHYGWVFLSRILNRGLDTYEETVATLDGMVIYEVAEPLSFHRGRGSARNGLPTAPRPVALRRVRPGETQLEVRIVPKDCAGGWDALKPDAVRPA